MTKPGLGFDRSLIRPGTRVCVALSGGADSVALIRVLDAANKLRRESLGVSLSAVHVHHGLRGVEADADEAFVMALCARLEIALAVHRVSVPEQKARTGKTIEEVARTLRYEIFRQVLSSGTADDIITAHTLDDQAETVLMKILRGAWTEGLSGIHPVLTGPRGRIVRPMLATSRAEVVTYLEFIGQPWREDATNADPQHTRNRLRHQILPLLRQENPSVDRTLANLALLAREEEDRWQRDLNRLLPQLLLPGTPVRGGGRSVSASSSEPMVAVDIDRLRGLDNPTRRRVVRAAVKSLHCSNSGGLRLSFEETASLLALCGFDPKPTVSARDGAVLQLSGGVTARRSFRELRLSFEAKPASAKTRAKH